MTISNFRAYFLLFIFFLSAFISPLYAVQAKSLESDGLIVLDDQRRIRLMGLEPLSEESLASLSVIISGKNLYFEPAKDRQEAELEGPIPGYLSVDAFEIDFPFKPNTQSRETRVMINQLLVSLGFAKVDTSLDFKYKESFLKVEARAKELGQGVWSYEFFPKKKKK